MISYEEGKALAESWNAAFLESSAKENQVRGFENSTALYPLSRGCVCCRVSVSVRSPSLLFSLPPPTISSTQLWVALGR